LGDLIICDGPSIVLCREASSSIHSHVKLDRSVAKPYSSLMFNLFSGDNSVLQKCCQIKKTCMLFLQ